MYIHIYMYIYIYIYIHIYTYLYISIDIYATHHRTGLDSALKAMASSSFHSVPPLPVYMEAHLHPYFLPYIPTFKHVCVDMYIHVFMCKCTVHLYMHT